MDPEGQQSHRWPLGTVMGGLERSITSCRCATLVTPATTSGVPSHNLTDRVGLGTDAPTLVWGDLQRGEVVEDRATFAHTRIRFLGVKA